MIAHVECHCDSCSWERAEARKIYDAERKRQRDAAMHAVPKSFCEECNCAPCGCSPRWVLRALSTDLNTGLREIR